VDVVSRGGGVAGDVRGRVCRGEKGRVFEVREDGGLRELFGAPSGPATRVLAVYGTLEGVDALGFDWFDPEEGHTALRGRDTEEATVEEDEHGRDGEHEQGRLGVRRQPVCVPGEEELDLCERQHRGGKRTLVLEISSELVRSTRRISRGR
jgi:hypothetical protein